MAYSCTNPNHTGMHRAWVCAFDSLPSAKGVQSPASTPGLHHSPGHWQLLGLYPSRPCSNQLARLL